MSQRESKHRESKELSDESLDEFLAVAFGSDHPRSADDADSFQPSVNWLLRNRSSVQLSESGEEGSPVVQSDQLPPEHLLTDRYELFSEIGRGGMGTIYGGRDKAVGRELAVKVLRDEYQNRPDSLERFVSEGRIAGQLQHPGIVPVYDVGECIDGRPFLTMKLVKGETLAQLLTDRPARSDDQTRFLEILTRICETLAFAHSRGVIHRDLKPSNVMVGSFGEVQVMDWGLAKVLASPQGLDANQSQTDQQEVSHKQSSATHSADAAETDSSPLDRQETHDGSILGTPPYISPEQAWGEIDHLDERTDVFGLGAILCEILTGQPPYICDDVDELRRRAAAADLADALNRLEECDADSELISLARQCLAPDPQHRPRDAGVVADALAAWQKSLDKRLRQSELDNAAAQATTKHERKLRWMTMLLASIVLLFAATGAGVWSWVQKDRQQRIMAMNEHIVAMNDQLKKDLRKAKEKQFHIISKRILNDLLGSLNAIDVLRGDIDAEDILAAVERTIDTAFPDDPEVEAGARLVLSSIQLGRKRYDPALMHAEKAVSLLTMHLGPDHPMTLDAMEQLVRVHQIVPPFPEFEKNDGIVLTIEAGDATQKCDYKTIGRPLDHDYADASNENVVLKAIGPLDGRSGGIDVLRDGDGQSNPDAPSESLLFRDGARHAFLLMDLGRVVPVTKINTYTWAQDNRFGDDIRLHGRAPQRYVLYGSASQTAPPSDGDLSKSGWTPIAIVDTDAWFQVPQKGTWNNRPPQQAVSITSRNGPVAKVRYLLWHVFPPKNGAHQHSGFGEIDVFVKDSSRDGAGPH